jgi:hypothetical protein
LVCSRISPQEVAIDYASQRQMSSLGVGIIRGIAKHYGENVRIQVTHFDSNGTKKCRILIHLEGKKD